jgi:hypothetical protein
MEMIREKGSFVPHMENNSTRPRFDATLLTHRVDACSRDEKERVSRQHTRDFLFLGLTPGTKIWLADT